MSDWLPFALSTLLVWGLWGFLPKLATNQLAPRSVLLYDVAGTMAVGLAVALLFGFRAEFQPRGAVYGAFTGAAGTLGALLLFYALRNGGKVAVVIPMTSLYPVITILLALVFLREHVTLKQALGIVCAVAATLLFSL